MVDQHALLRESNNIPKLLEKISTYIYTNVNQNLMWEFEPLISSVIEQSGHSIMFIILFIVVFIMLFIIVFIMLYLMQTLIITERSS